MFIRIKNIKNKKGKVYPYAYLVDNKWYKRGNKGKGKGSRQKVKMYLGRVHSFSKVQDINFLGYLRINNIDDYILKNDKNKIIKNLVEWEFFKYDVDKEEFLVDFRNRKVLKGGKEVSLKLNEGVLNSYTLGRLLRFRFNGDEREDGLKMAKAFVEAGLEVPKEVFIGIFNKVYK